MTVFNEYTSFCFYSAPSPEKDCPICWFNELPDTGEQPRVVHDIAAQHIFHESCLRTSLEYQGNQCPMCRAELIHPLAPLEDPLQNVARTTTLMKFITAAERGSEEADEQLQQLDLSAQEKQDLAKFLAFQGKKDAFLRIFSTDHRQALLSAASCGFKEALEELLQRETATVDDCSQALIRAKEHNQKEIVSWILQNKPVNETGRSIILHFLIKKHMFSLVPPLLQKSIPSEEIHQAIQTAPLYSCPIEIFRLLLEKAPDIPSGSIEISLERAAKARPPNWDLISFLLEGREISTNCLTLLRVKAAWSGKVELLQQLLQRGEPSDDEYDNILQGAASGNYVEIVNMIAGKCTSEALWKAKMLAELEDSTESLEALRNFTDLTPPYFGNF